METWVWLTGYVVGFGLLQVLLYRYFQRREPTPETTAGGFDRGDAGGRSVSRPETDVVVNCEACGAANESHRMIRYCGECTASLR
ncbi:DUF7577 domain-containing protein [Haloarcula marina]|uniref:DUF7577 domain-containing protein n=1 Tax=Haloarcula marina TaxID=2961574 RepID=UPI0020B86CB8|nr:hypothetical protein [Halomicroarcula marina]